MSSIHPGALSSGSSSSLPPSPPNHQGHMQPSPTSGTTNSPDAWTYPSQNPPMIGPTSSFYGLDDSVSTQPDADTHPYQQWIDNNYNARQQYNSGVVQTYAQYGASLGDMIPPSNLYQQQQPAYESAYKSELLHATRPVARPKPNNPQLPIPGPGLQAWGNALNSIQNVQSYPLQARPGQHSQPAHQISVVQKTQQVALPPTQFIQKNVAGGSQHHTPSPQNLQPHDRPQPAPSQSPPRPPVGQSHPSQAPNGINASNPRQIHVNGRGTGPYSSGQLNIRQYEFKPQPPSPATTSPDQPSASTNIASGSGSGISQVGRNLQKNAPTNGTLKRNAHALPQSPQGSTVSDSAQRKRKRARRSEGNANHAAEGDTEGEEESEEDDADGGISVGIKGVAGEGRTGKGLRLPGACKHCKKLKMKCDFPKGDNTCKRCRASGHVCIVEGRKPRTAPNKREYLLAQIRQKDAIIESLLKQLHNPYLATPLSIASYRMATSPSDQDNTNVLAWLDRLQSSVENAGGSGGPSAFTELRNQEDADSDGESDTAANDIAPQEDDGAEDGSSNEADNMQNTLPDAHVPLGLLANMSISSGKSKGKKDRGRNVNLTEEDLNDDNVGVANETYFLPGPATDLGIRASLIEQHSPPEILVHGLVNPDDVQKLFDIFYSYVNPFVSLLDPVLHTPASTFARCPFLFTVVCAIASRYYVEKSEIYPIAMHFAKHSAANALIDGWKSVELCQAYILMSIYAVPARRWEEDRSWLYTGLAIRIATDLNLHHASPTKPKSEKEEREVLNRARVWMICFNLDRSTATQFGKPSTIKEDFIVRNARDWYLKSQYNLPYDIHLCAHSALLQIVNRFHDEIFSDPSSPSRLNKNVDFRKITLKHDENLTQYHQEWLRRFEEGSDPQDPGCALRCSLLPFLVDYSRLVMFSFGFQQAFHRGIERSDQVFFTKCLEAAKSVIVNMVDKLAPSGYMRYAPDGHFVFSAFASAFLLKLLRPEFASLLTKEQEGDIFELIGRLIQTLSSPKIAIDDRHTPKLYARFLAGLLSRHRRDGATVGRLHPNPPGHAQADAASQIPAASMTTFSVTQPPQNSMQSDSGFGYDPNGMHSSQSQQALQTPIYRPEATYNAGTGPIHFGSDTELALLGSGYSPDEEMLATMQAIKSPSWWQNMMMPGFSWTPDPSPSPPHVMGHQQQPPQPPQAPQQPSYHPGMHLQAGSSMPHVMQHGAFNPIQIASMF